MSGTGSARNDDIETLRGFAVLMVLYEHLGVIHYSEPLRGLRQVLTGWTGVDLFFCVSGFVIYRSLAAVLEHGQPAAEATRQIVAFWIRRVWRLAPAAWLWLLVGLPAGILARLSLGASAPSIYQHLVTATAALLNVENVHRYVCDTNPMHCGSVFSHYWSLSLEVQFYLVLPLAMLWLPRRWLAGLMAALIVVQFAIPRPPFNGSLLWYLRTDAIAWGVLLGIAMQGRMGAVLRPAFLASGPARAAFTLGLLGLLGTAKMFDPEDIFAGIAGVLSAGLVWAASCNAGYIWRPRWAAAALRWIGLRSYSLYVCHLIVFSYAGTALGRFDGTLGGVLLHAAVAYGGTFVAAALTYALVERPFRRRGRDAAARYLAATAA